MQGIHCRAELDGSRVDKSAVAGAPDVEARLAEVAAAGEAAALTDAHQHEPLVARERNRILLLDEPGRGTVGGHDPKPLLW